MDDANTDERWWQYWHDNGEQLVWNDWLQKYPEYTDNCFTESNRSSAELINNSETCPVMYQLSENTDSARNDDEVSVNKKCHVDSETVSYTHLTLPTNREV